MSKLTFAAVKRFVDIPDPFDLVIDPASPLFKQIKPSCDPVNPAKCLVATLGFIQSHGHKTTFTFDHTPEGPVKPKLKISLGDGYSAYKTDVSPDLLSVASKFDQNARIRKLAYEHIDLSDGSWTFVYRKSRGGAKTPANKNGRGKDDIATALMKSRRAKTLQAVRKSFA
jgi:hypothetical protein